MRSRRSLTTIPCLLLIVAGTGLAVFLLPQPVTAQESASEIQVPDSADAVVKVHGMACQMCAQSVKRSLEGVEDVDAAHVHLDEQRALLTLTGDHSVTENLLRTTVEKAGYEFEAVTFASETETSSDG